MKKFAISIDIAVPNQPQVIRTLLETWKTIVEKSKIGMYNISYNVHSNKTDHRTYTLSARGNAIDDLQVETAYRTIKRYVDMTYLSLTTCNSLQIEEE